MHLEEEGSREKEQLAHWLWHAGGAGERPACRGRVGEREESRGSSQRAEGPSCGPLWGLWPLPTVSGEAPGWC